MIYFLLILFASAANAAPLNKSFTVKTWMAKSNTSTTYSIDVPGEKLLVSADHQVTKKLKLDRTTLSLLRTNLTHLTATLKHQPNCRGSSYVELASPAATKRVCAPIIEQPELEQLLSVLAAAN